MPSGPWPADPRLKEIGVFLQHDVDSDVESCILFFTNVQQWSREQVQMYITHLRPELHSMKHHVYHYESVVWGGKPRADELFGGAAALAPATAE